MADITDKFKTNLDEQVAICGLDSNNLPRHSQKIPTGNPPELTDHYCCDSRIAECPFGATSNNKSYCTYTHNNSK